MNFFKINKFKKICNKNGYFYWKTKDNYDFSKENFNFLLAN